jgi:hypothetical protein
MADLFSAFADSLGAPATRTRAVVPHDVNPLPNIPKALYVGTGGDVTLRGINDKADTLFANVPSGGLLPVRAAYVRDTGTGAADIVALY